MIYLFSPSFASVALGFASLPWLLKFLTKLAWVAPNAYHFFNGFRHLDWDTRVSLSLPELYASGRSVAYFTAGVTGLWLLSRMFAKKEEAPIKKKMAVAHH